MLRTILLLENTFHPMLQSTPHVSLHEIPHNARAVNEIRAERVSVTVIACASDKLGPFGTPGQNLALPSVDSVHCCRVGVATGASHLPRPLGNYIRFL